MTASFRRRAFRRRTARADARGRATRCWRLRARPNSPVAKPAALDALKPSWDALPPDEYLKDGGRYRRRRHSCFVFETTCSSQAPHRAHWQSLTTTPCMAACTAGSSRSSRPWSPRRRGPGCCPVGARVPGYAWHRLSASRRTSSGSIPATGSAGPRRRARTATATWISSP